MDTKALLEQLLESGRKLAEQGMARVQSSGLADKGKQLAEKGKQLAQQGVEYAKDQLPPPGPERDKLLKNLSLIHI